MNEDRNGNEEQRESPPPIILVDFGFLSEELSFFRRTLRFLSLWQPDDAWKVERFLYPAFVNIILLSTVLADLQMLVNHNWTSFDVYVYMIIDIGMYFSHILGILYFKSRDMETNMLNLGLRHCEDVDAFRKKLRKLKILVVFTFSTLTALILLFYNLHAWRQHRIVCNSVFTFIKGILNHIVCSLNYPANIYGIGNSLAITWTICLLQQTYFIRTKQLERNYRIWQETTEAAIYDHILNYSRIVKMSCVKLEKWFLIHNVILAIATPFLISDIIKTFKSIGHKDHVHASLLLGYLLYTIVVWMLPLYFAEMLQLHDENLCMAINEFCPGTYYEEFENDQNPVNCTFHSRIEVNKFLSYLTHRKSGFLIGSYSFQFKLSMVSIVLAMIAFATRIIV